MKGLPSLDRLLRALQQVPYLASKNLYRVAAHFLARNESSLQQFCAVLLDAKRNIVLCKKCCNLSEGADLCAICRSHDREPGLICVVETWQDLVAIERAGGYTGVYHVLGGALCPLEGIGPDQLTVSVLFDRVTRDEVRELIFATNPTPEGEATASYIASKVPAGNIVVSRLASGVPTGSTLECMDRVTIFKALSGRRPF